MCPLPSLQTSQFHIQWYDTVFLSDCQWKDHRNIQAYFCSIGLYMEVGIWVVLFCWASYIFLQVGGYFGERKK